MSNSELKIHLGYSRMREPKRKTHPIYSKAALCWLMTKDRPA